MAVKKHCSTCPAFVMLDIVKGSGECHYHAPAPVVKPRDFAAAPNVETCWPLTYADEFCMQHPAFDVPPPPPPQYGLRPLPPCTPPAQAVNTKPLPPLPEAVQDQIHLLKLRHMQFMPREPDTETER